MLTGYLIGFIIAGKENRIEEKTREKQKKYAGKNNPSLLRLDII